MPTDWLLGLIGGLMIGGAAAAYLLGAGRIMGASGIISDAANPATPLRVWLERMAFLIGLAGMPLLLLKLTGAGPFPAVAGLPMLVAAGLLVGFGARLGSGCTSGHGVCGISRLSPRGILATLMFIGTGIATVTILRLMGWA